MTHRYKVSKCYWEKMALIQVYHKVPTKKKRQLSVKCTKMKYACNYFRKTQSFMVISYYGWKVPTG